MIIVCSREGQMCNRMFHLSHILSYALSRNETLWYPYFNEYSHLYKNLDKENTKKVKLILLSNIGIRFILKCFRILVKLIPKNRYIQEISGIDLINLSDLYRNKKSILLLKGWLLRDNKNFIKFQDTFRFLFLLDIKERREDNYIRLQAWKLKYNIIVGVHIRRGDYKYFLNGKYFYSVEIYLEKINQLREILQKQKNKCLFIVCSNDSTLLLNPLLQKEDIILNQGSELDDLSVLSSCDFIIGPPSTFSGWASFYGKVPLHFIEEKNEIMRLSNFSVVQN